MKKLHQLVALFALLLSLVFFGGCANGPQVDPQITATVAAHHVNQGTYNKIFNAQTLDYSDIMNLVKGGVPSHITVDYIRSTQKVYDFNYNQLSSLKSAGAKPHLLNYLTETQGFYGITPTAKSGSKTPSDVKYNTKLNQDRQPFFYNAPIVDDWYDSGYTESCYSPFSFN